MSPKKVTKSPATSATSKASKGLTPEERAALRETIAERRAAAGKAEEKNLVATHVYDKREKLTVINLAETDYKHVDQADWQRAADRKIILDPRSVSPALRLAQLVGAKKSCICSEAFSRKTTLP